MELKYKVCKYNKKEQLWGSCIVLQFNTERYLLYPLNVWVEAKTELGIFTFDSIFNAKEFMYDCKIDNPDEFAVFSCYTSTLVTTDVYMTFFMETNKLLELPRGTERYQCIKLLERIYEV